MELLDKPFLQLFNPLKSTCWECWSRRWLPRIVTETVRKYAFKQTHLIGNVHLQIETRTWGNALNFIYYDIHRCPFHEIRGNLWENPCPRLCPDLQGGPHQCLGCLPPVLIDMLRSAEPFSNWKSCGAQPSIVYHHLSSSPVVSTMHLQGLAISCVGASFGLAMISFFSSWVHPGTGSDL